jgi:hypothetical protein
MCPPHYRRWRRDQGLDQKQTKEYAAKFQRTLQGRWTALKQAAKNKDLGFNITKEQHRYLLSLPCEYCKESLNETGHALDRKDSTVGYLFTNVVPCCYNCNKIKNDILTYEEMLAAMEAVLEVRAKNNPSKT